MSFDKSITLTTIYINQGLVFSLGFRFMVGTPGVEPGSLDFQSIAMTASAKCPYGGLSRSCTYGVSYVEVLQTPAIATRHTNPFVGVLGEV